MFQETKTRFDSQPAQSPQGVIPHISLAPSTEAAADSADVAASGDPRFRVVNEDAGETTVTPRAPILTDIARPPDISRWYLWRAASAGLPRIVIDPTILDGIPVIRNTRISVAQLLDVLTDMGTIEAVIHEFPDMLEPADVQEALIFAAQLVR